MDRRKAEQGRGRKKRKIRREKIREEKESEERRYRCVKRYESCELCFLIICGFGGSKNRFAKAAGAEPAGQIKNKKLSLWHRPYFQVKIYKIYQIRTTFRN